MYCGCKMNWEASPLVALCNYPSIPKYKALTTTVSSVARDVTTSAAADFVHFCCFCAVFKSRYIIKGIMMHIDL